MILKVRIPGGGWQYYEADNVGFTRITGSEVGLHMREDKNTDILMNSSDEEMQESGKIVAIRAYVEHRDRRKNVVFDTDGYLCNDNGRTLQILDISREG
jgi:hypothetical protein